MDFISIDKVRYTSEVIRVCPVWCDHAAIFLPCMADDLSEVCVEAGERGGGPLKAFLFHPLEI